MKQHPETPLIMKKMFDIYERREVPYSYVRMATYAMIATALSRNVYMSYGGKLLYPNLYVVLVGEPATKKSTIINHCRRMLMAAGHRAFSSTHLTRSKLIFNLASNSFESASSCNAEIAEGYMDDLVKIYSKSAKIQALAAEAAKSAKTGVSFRSLCSPVADTSADDIDLNSVDIETADGILGNVGKVNRLSVYLDELPDGAAKGGSADLWMTVTNLWDCSPYVDMNGVAVPRPCVNMLCGINPASFTRVFPVNEMQSGLITRIILTHGMRTGRVLAPFDIDPDAALEGELEIIEDLHRIVAVQGEINLTEPAKRVLRQIMVKQPKIADTRLSYYYDRRLEHLTKMCMCHAVMHGRMEVTAADVMYCNTALTANDWRMPEALGDYGTNNVVRAADKLLRELRTYAQTPEGVETGGGLSKRDLQGRVRATISNSSEFVQALSHLVSLGLVTSNGDIYYANIVTLESLKSSGDGQIFESSMCPEWEGL